MDIIIIIVIVSIGLVFWLLNNYVFAEPGTFAEIYYRSELVERVDLTSAMERRFSVDQTPNVVFYLYGDGSIAFIESDCPDKICVLSGKLSRTGQYAACLPNEIYIKIVSEGGEHSDDPDMIIG